MEKQARVSDRGVLVLTSLAAGDKHGWALMQDIEEFAGVKLGPGTLYALLSKLEAAGLIESLALDDRRRPYRITAAGHKALRERLMSYHRIAGVGLARIGADA
jgi:DNA-binding PadR family transcriptional regulator